jgi:hypothetical protein
LGIGVRGITKVEQHGVKMISSVREGDMLWMSVVKSSHTMHPTSCPQHATGFIRAGAISGIGIDKIVEDIHACTTLLILDRPHRSQSNKRR